ncbi:MAG: hypothetical protein AB8I58_13970 [Anaerolineales bacterium]|jgi:hypothetical protein
MSSDEQKQILKMLEEGKISADEAMTLIKALEETPAEGEIEVIETEAGPDQGRSVGPEFEEVKTRARRFAMIPMWIGVLFTVLGAYWMYALVQKANYGFWFFFAWLPLLLGILLVAISAGGMNSRWLYVNVDQEPGEWPQHITLGFPIPLGIIGWFLRNFGHYIRGMDKTNVDEILMALSMANHLDEPLIVNVDEGDDGERVQVYIG